MIEDVYLARCFVVTVVTFVTGVTGVGVSAGREGVALIDMSFMSKFLVQGRDAGVAAASFKWLFGFLLLSIYIRCLYTIKKLC